MVCSRVNLCNNWCIFWLSETTKTPLCFALYTQGISFWTDAFQRVYKWDRDRRRRIWDYYNSLCTDWIPKNLCYKQIFIFGKIFLHLHRPNCCCRRLRKSENEFEMNRCVALNWVYHGNNNSTGIYILAKG